MMFGDVQWEKSARSVVASGPSEVQLSYQNKVVSPRPRDTPVNAH